MEFPRNRRGYRYGWLTLVSTVFVQDQSWKVGLTCPQLYVLGCIKSYGLADVLALSVFDAESDGRPWMGVTSMAARG